MGSTEIIHKRIVCIHAYIFPEGYWSKRQCCSLDGITEVGDNCVCRLSSSLTFFFKKKTTIFTEFLSF